jgi:hypothetical protein
VFPWIQSGRVFHWMFILCLTICKEWLNYIETFVTSGANSSLVFRVKLQPVTLTVDNEELTPCRSKNAAAA